MYDMLINYKQDTYSYGFSRCVTLSYEHSNNFLLFNFKASCIVSKNDYNKYCPIILQAEYFR